MQELVQRMLEEVVGVKVSPEEVAELARRYERLLAAMKKLDGELELWRWDPMPTFSREERS